MNRLLPLALATSLGLSACNGSDNNTVSLPPAVQDIADFVRSLIAGRTCETSLPSAINGVELQFSETTVDVSTVAPSCSG